MKRYLLLHYGFVEPTPEIMEGWNSWFTEVGDNLVEMAGFNGGLEISKDGVKELGWDLEAITGYNIITAESMDEAKKIAEGNPFITSIRVYELRSE